ncbi:4'-phosphopantetheine phosphatase-like isoform X1 [Corticium candelabrum]|uniref:4'-phosphopantetheine phosphatase-like isoform X1 n=1 Tax=Corticium candelabrum TaxID=121492 RepID=UPI002E270A1E|nr:4'-phosphopantetheine phosphatase-like isoform X1 [Corticium candelabrum]
MECLIRGSNFLLKNIPNESFIFQRDSVPRFLFQDFGSNIFPYLLVNIGSGVSIVKVDSESEFKRIGGTSMGGGTFWGLGSLITEAKGFDELLQLASMGNHKNVDMLVGDIYGGHYEMLGLPSDIIASSFGKASRSSKEDTETRGRFRDADKAKSLLHMISNDIGQIAYLNAKLHNLKRIYFGGYFIRGHPVTMHTITFAINYWSKGEVQALFLRHEGYLGAVGAFLNGAEEENIPISSWCENFAGSSGFVNNFSRPLPTPYDVLELDHRDRHLTSFPLLKGAASYVPDLINLSVDGVARQYWLHCFEEMVDKIADCAAASQDNRLHATQRAETFRQKHRAQLAILSTEPSAYGTLTVRSLLNARQQCLVECGFPDPYAMIKKVENEAALQNFVERLNMLDTLSWEERQLNLIEGVLSGNMFDWGAKEVTKLMEVGHLPFDAAKAKLQRRPWLVDAFDDWLERLRGPPHSCAVIFTDNSGNDVILGIFPFVRELLNRGTKVILAANSLPSLNDVVANELKILLAAAADMCPTFQLACEEGNLMVMETESESPCIDLRAVDLFLAEESVRLNVDLVLLEGMGRAVHTNFDAIFTCECLKLAVLKNQWLAQRLGGHTFDVIFKFERP